MKRKRSERFFAIPMIPRGRRYHWQLIQTIVFWMVWLWLSEGISGALKVLCQFSRHGAEARIGDPRCNGFDFLEKSSRKKREILSNWRDR